ncbi:MAG: cellulose-binding protein [Methylococcus sp.]|nr:MAG: cellulose-binding protein [Methylococcus sp.]
MNPIFRSLKGGVLMAVTAIGCLAQSAQAATSPAPVPQVIITASSSWGTASDSWAGYSGQINVWVPQKVTGPWTLRFQSTDLGKEVAPSAFWNAVASYDATTSTFTLVSPTWGGDVAANTTLNVGFNGSGVLSTGFTLTNCTLNGQPCTASVMTLKTAEQTLQNLKASGSGSVAPSPLQDNQPAPPAPNPSSGPILQVLFSLDSAWQGGYGGTIAVKNLSAAPLIGGATGWRAKVKFPDLATAQDVFKSGPWNFQIAFANDGTVTLSPMSWSSALAAGGTTTSGFNGGAAANLQKAASADSKVTVLYSASASNPSTTPTPTPVTPVPVTPPVNNNIGLPTGTVVGGFLFSPYKDVGTSMNWNTYVMSTSVTGSLNPLLNAIPAKLPAVTWAFATGECGQENWAGINPDTLAGANVKAYSDANKNYVISTGGAAGTFTCSSINGMRTFINRYASKNLVGVDFDIEVGQTAAVIESLIAQIKGVQADYPNLRFSFTIATLGSSNGLASSAPYGDLNVTGYNVMMALAKYPLTNYTINLMVMDYGAAGSGVCVVGSSGHCDMGQTAIQAAKNLTARYGVPSERIELTPMIGVNDVIDEVFSLQDVDTMVQWGKANKLAGVHFWSIDRDVPCSQASASSTCSSVATGGVYGWTQRFIGDLGL